MFYYLLLHLFIFTTVSSRSVEQEKETKAPSHFKEEDLVNDVPEAHLWATRTDDFDREETKPPSTDQSRRLTKGAQTRPKFNSTFSKLLLRMRNRPESFVANHESSSVISTKPTASKPIQLTPPPPPTQLAPLIEPPFPPTFRRHEPGNYFPRPILEDFEEYELPIPHPSWKPFFYHPHQLHHSPPPPPQQLNSFPTAQRSDLMAPNADSGILSLTPANVDKNKPFYFNYERNPVWPLVAPRQDLGRHCSQNY